MEVYEMIPQAWMERLFLRLTTIYGEPKMASFFGDCPQADVIDSWRTGLEGFSGEQIGAGLKRMLDVHPEWPPTLGEFRALCRPPVVNHVHRPYLVDKTPRKPIPPEIKAGIDALVAKLRSRP